MSAALILKLSTALDDWLNTYASEFCDKARVKEAWRRIHENGGTLAYIANLQEEVRAARPEGGTPVTSAEEKLAAAGVYAGHDGLRGFAEAHEFWERQPYGTRFYYGSGGGHYLHRSILRAAIRILDGSDMNSGGDK